MLLRYCLPDGKRDLAVLLRGAVSRDFLNEHQPLLIGCFDGECRRGHRQQPFTAALRRLFDVLRMEIAPADDDQILEPSRKEQRAAMEKSKVAGSKEWPVAGTGEMRAEGRFRFLAAVPI